MKERFSGQDLVDALMQQRIVGGDRNLAEAMAALVDIDDIGAGTSIIEQLDESSDIYFVLAGEFEVLVNKRLVAICRDRDCVGEMAAIHTQPRSATVRAKAPSTVARLSAEQFQSLAQKFPDVYRLLAKDLARRVMERNALVAQERIKPRVFIISSTEALPVGRALEAAFEHDKFDVTVWTDGVFKVTNYTLEDLERELDRCDFAVAIAHPDDHLTWREEDWPAPRDNVILELGMFMGRLGRNRALLMEPRDQKVKLPSDWAGINTISYKLAPPEELARAIGPAATKIRNHINAFGVIR